MSQKDTEKNKRKKKKGTGLIVVCVTLLILLFAVLIILIWQISRVGNGETVGFGGKTGNTQAVSQNTPSVTQEAALTSSSGSEANAEEVQTQAQTEAAQAESAAGQTQAAGQATMMEPQTYENDANGNMIVPERQAGSMETEPAWEYVLEKTGDSVLDDANYLAAMYDYDGAIAKIQSVSGYESNAAYTAAIADYEQRKSEAVVYADNSTIPHIFFHTLVVDTSRAFDDNIAISKQDGMNKVKDYNYVMTTVDEFCRILEEMYTRGYVLVSIYDVASYETQADGTQVMKHQPIYLPEGKKPFVLSVDDVSYYEYMTGHGFASKLVVGEDGTPTSEYTNPDGSLSYGSYDVVPILDDFVETHPDFSYRGAKGIIALTGYEGIFGYRTSDFWYNSNCDYFDQYFSWNLENNLKKKQTMYQPNPNIEQDKESAKQVAQACRDDGWLFASHTWGHINVGEASLERLQTDTQKWLDYVKPLVGDTNVIIFAFGSDLGDWQPYTSDNEKFAYLKSMGFDIYCNVDSTQYWVQFGENYMRQGRRNLDGYRMYYNPEMLEDLFDAGEVFDKSRPTPVPEM